MLFEAHDEMIGSALRLDESHEPVLDYVFPMGPEYDLRVEDMLWRGAHDRQHADDIRRAMEIGLPAGDAIVHPRGRAQASLGWC